jgi:hypothetical protein
MTTGNGASNTLTLSLLLQYLTYTSPVSRTTPGLIEVIEHLEVRRVVRAINAMNAPTRLSVSSVR